MLQPQYLLFMFGGVALGLFIGFLPGLSGGMGIGLMLPFTFHMEPLTALVFLCSIYTGGIFGGAVGTVFLLAMAGPLADFSLKFGPGEMFFVAIFGLTVVGSLSDNVIKGIFSGLFGILLGTVGLSANGVSRGTMGILYLMDGIPTIPALLGLLALPAIYELSGRKSAVLKVNTVSSGFASLRGLLQGFQDTLRRDGRRYKAIRCTQNPMLGREASLHYPPAPAELKKKKILIAGAGPAGLEAACVLARRGLKPVVMDEKPQPGGLIGIAPVPPLKGNMNRITEYRTALLQQMGIEIRLNVHVDEEILRAEKPDIVFAATGSRSAVPSVKGAGGSNVFLADDVLGGREVPGQHVALLGAGLVGAETAEYLAGQGKDVEIFDSIHELVPDLNKARRWFQIKRIQECGIRQHMDSKIVEIALPDISYETGGKVETLGGFDAVVLAAGRRSNNEFAAMVRQSFPEVELHEIGDAETADTSLEAIAGATMAAAALA